MKWNRTRGSWVISLTLETFPSNKQMNKALNIMQVGCPLPLEKGVLPHSNKLTLPCFVPSLVEVCPVVLWEKILWILVTYFCQYAIILPLEKDVVFHLDKLELLHTRVLALIVPSSGEFGQAVLKKKTFKCRWIILLLSPLEKDVALHLNNSNLRHLRMFWAKFDWNWPRCFVEEEKCEKFSTTIIPTGNGQSSLESSAKVS